MHTILLVVLCILLPPLAVALKEGVSNQFWINLVLTIVGLWVCGVVHALYVVVARK